MLYICGANKKNICTKMCRYVQQKMCTYVWLRDNSDRWSVCLVERCFYEAKKKTQQKTLHLALLAEVLCSVAGVCVCVCVCVRVGPHLPKV